MWSEEGEAVLADYVHLEKPVFRQSTEKARVPIKEEQIWYMQIQGFPKKTPVPQKSKIFLIYSVMIRKAK